MAVARYGHTQSYWEYIYHYGLDGGGAKATPAWCNRLHRVGDVAHHGHRLQRELSSCAR
jgi:hypothetical protein